MSKLLVVSYSGFSDSNANGKTLKSLLCKWSKRDLAQFYCGAEMEDLSFCSTFFHVTDKQMLESFYKRIPSKIVEDEQIQQQKKTNTPKSSYSRNLSSKIRRFNYNFVLRTLRETLWMLSPWGRREYKEWVARFDPSAIFYMVGESWFMDRLVLKTAKLYKIPIILYNCEAYRLVDPRDRKGWGKYYYKMVEKSYKKLIKHSDKVIYNSRFLMNAYQKKYKVPSNVSVVYNASYFDTCQYTPNNDKLIITYFGNLGVGRIPSIIQVANVLSESYPDLHIDVYGKVINDVDEKMLASHPNIKFYGLVTPDNLVTLKEEADILLHVESFDKSVVSKLRYAFSTKIAQYLCAGRAVLTFAPSETASTKYLLEENAALVATNTNELREHLKKLIENPNFRKIMSTKALECARKNHDINLSSKTVKCLVEEEMQ